MDPVRNASTRFAALSALFDSTTRRHLADRGVAPGWHCLEVGGGSGSIATWLSERVGPTGRVTVTDVDDPVSGAHQAAECRGALSRHHTRLAAGAGLRSHSYADGAHAPAGARPGAGSPARPHSSREGGSFAKNSTAVRTSQPGVCPGEIALKTHEAMGRLHHDQGVAPHYGTAAVWPLARDGSHRPRRGSAPGDGAVRDRGAPHCCAPATNGAVVP